MTDPFEAAVTEAEGAPFIEAFGNTYELRRKPPSMPLMKFSKLASKGMRTDNMEAGAALYDVLRFLFTADDWPRFEDDATEAGLDNDELLVIVGQAFRVIAGFPTTQSSGSPSTPSSTSQSSTVTSFEERKRALGMERVTPSSIAALVG